MLMGAAHNALWAFNARVSLTLPVCHRPQAATLALRSGAVRSPVTVVPSCGLETRSWRTGRMARHKQECIRLPYTAALASQRAFFVKVLHPFTKERNREPNNPYDKQAIVIKTGNGVKIGYVPKQDNIVFSRLMDAGKLLFGRISGKEKKGKWVVIKIKVFLHE